MHGDGGINPIPDTATKKLNQMKNKVQKTNDAFKALALADLEYETKNHNKRPKHKTNCRHVV
jgi:hypothetical protein